jgi:AraC-like DNA-binding protein
MPPVTTVRALCVTPIVRVFDWICAGHDHGRAEAASRDEIVYVRSGAFRKRVGSREISADPAAAVFFARDEEYRIDHPEGCGDRCLIVAVDPGELDEIAGRRRRGQGAFGGALRATLSTTAALLLHRLVVVARPADTLAVEEAAVELVGETLAGREACEPYGWRGTEAAHRREVERARLVMAARLGEPLMLSEIARETAYSPWHLARVFRALTGMTLHRHLTRLRLLRALDLLDDGASLATIAFAVGFSSHSHFTAAFRREFGLPPGRLRDRAAR